MTDWSRPFPEPIELPGKTLSTLRDAASYIQSLPKAEQSEPHWLDAVEHLIKAAEGSEGWVLFARMFILKALNHGKLDEPRVVRKKAAKVYKIIR